MSSYRKVRGNNKRQKHRNRAMYKDTMELENVADHQMVLKFECCQRGGSSIEEWGIP